MKQGSINSSFQFSQRHYLDLILTFNKFNKGFTLTMLLRHGKKSICEYVFIFISLLMKRLREFNPNDHKLI